MPKGVKFIVIKGNHDNTLVNPKITEIVSFKEIRLGNTLVTLCHYPLVVWNESYCNSWDLYDHVHMKQTNKIFQPTSKMLNVNCEYHNFKPWSEDEITSYMNDKEDNFDYTPDYDKFKTT